MGSLDMSQNLKPKLKWFFKLKLKPNVFLLNCIPAAVGGDRLVDAEAAADIAVFALRQGALHQHGEGGTIRGGRRGWVGRGILKERGFDCRLSFYVQGDTAVWTFNIRSLY